MCAQLVVPQLSWLPYSLLASESDGGAEWWTLNQRGSAGWKQSCVAGELDVNVDVMTIATMTLKFQSPGYACAHCYLQLHFVVVAVLRRKNQKLPSLDCGIKN